MDLQLFRFINNRAGENQTLDAAMIAFSSYGVYVIIALILLLLVFWQTRHFAVCGVLALGSSLLLNRVLKLTIERPRPFMDNSVNLLIDRAPSPSFPSDQALICGVFVFVFWYVLRSLGRWLVLGLAVVMMFSRIYVGHHYPLDVLIGFGLGLLITFLVFKLANHLKSTQKAESHHRNVDIN